MNLKRELLHHLRRVVGTHHLPQDRSAIAANAHRLGVVEEYVRGLDAAHADRVEQLRGYLTHRLDQIEAHIRTLEESVPGARIPASAEGCTRVELNGDPMWIPDDLLKFVLHTNVGPAGKTPKLLAETEHYIWVKERLGISDTALDLGANIGLFTVMMARQIKYGLVGHVHALEASPTVFRDLCRVVRANGIDNAVLNQMAVSDRRGTAEFVDIGADNVTREASHLAVGGRPHDLDPGTNLVKVETISLDEYVEISGARPRLIKIDVEGAEFLALEGGRGFIGAAHPLLVIEIHPDASGVFDHARLRKYLDGYGYTYRHKDKTYYCE